MSSHSPDYMRPLEVPVRDFVPRRYEVSGVTDGQPLDVVLFGCTCGAEPGDCQWQVEVTNKTQVVTS